MHSFIYIGWIDECVWDKNTSVASYAKCIVVKPLSNSAPSFVFFVLGTDSKYDHTVISERWNHIELELKKCGITIVSFGQMGKSKSYVTNEIATSGLSAQDHIHLLAKLRTRLVSPSNIISPRKWNCMKLAKKQCHSKKRNFYWIADAVEKKVVPSCGRHQKLGLVVPFLSTVSEGSILVGIQDICWTRCREVLSVVVQFSYDGVWQ